MKLIRYIIIATIGVMSIAGARGASLPATNPALPENPETLSILFIGNSFTQDATEHLPAMLASQGINNVYMTRLFHGGYLLSEYLANWDKANVCAMRSAGPGDTGWSDTEALDNNPAKAMALRQWDIVVIQEHTGNAEAWSWPGKFKDALEGILKKINEAQPGHNPTIVYLMSQTYSIDSNVLKTSFGNDRYKMFKTTCNVARQVLAETYIDKIISTGAMLENLRTSSINNAKQLTRDTYHMDKGISRYGAACAVYETLITPTLGYKVSDCPFLYNKTITNDNEEYTTAVTATNAPIAQLAAHLAVLKPFSVTYTYVGAENKKWAAGQWHTQYGAPSTGGDLVTFGADDEPVQLVDFIESNSSTGFSPGWVRLAGGVKKATDVTVYWWPDSKQVKLVGTPSEDRAKLGITDAANGWKAPATYFTHEGDGIYTGTYDFGDNNSGLVTFKLRGETATPSYGFDPFGVTKPFGTATKSEISLYSDPAEESYSEYLTPYHADSDGWRIPGVASMATTTKTICTTAKSALQGQYNVRFDANNGQLTFHRPLTTTGEIEMLCNDGIEAQYYNLQGIRVVNPEPGTFYIKVQGSKATKMVY